MKDYRYSDLMTKDSRFLHVSRILRWIAFFVIALPVVSAVLSSGINGSNMFDESSGGGATLWLEAITFPLGVALFVAATVISLVQRRRK